MTPNQDRPAALRRPALLEMLGLSQATVHRMIARGDFPPSRQLGTRAVFWLRSEVEAWLAERPISDQPPVASRGKA